MKSNRGFTLIELLVVIAIIGILASVVMVSLNSARGKARDATRKSQLSELQKAVELYNIDNNNYPNTDGWIYDSTGTLHTALVPDYIKVIPKDPTFKAGGNGYYRYMYYSNNTQGWYCFYAQLESISSPDSSYTDAPYQPGGSGGYGMNYAVCGG